MFTRVATAYGRRLARSRFMLPWNRNLARENPTDYGKMALVGLLTVVVRLVARDRERRQQRVEQNLAIAQAITPLNERLAETERQRRDLRVHVVGAARAMTAFHAGIHDGECTPDSCDIEAALENIECALAEQRS